MIFEALPLQGAFMIRPEPVSDNRGHFARVFCTREFHAKGLHSDFPQHSVSFNKLRGTLRGLHFQVPPHAETKVVSCTRGRIYDVIVDIRKDSPTFGQWQGVELSASNSLALYVPTGFAHGFITLEDASDVHYMITPAHVPGFARAIRWDDPALAITWPLAPLVMSESDRLAQTFSLFMQEEAKQ